MATFSKQLVHKQRQMNTVLTGCINISPQLTVFCPHREVADFPCWGEDFRGKGREAAQAFLDACIRKQAVSVKFKGRIRPITFRFNKNLSMPL